MSTNRGPLPGTPEPDSSGQGYLPCEVKMLRFAAAGEQLDLGQGPFELSAMKAWAEDRTIRASVLRRLVVDEQWSVHASGVRLRGLRISGHLDLTAVILRCPLHLEDCYFDDPGPVVLSNAMASALTFHRCQVEGLHGDSLTVSRNLDLSGSTFAGPLRLAGASIVGRLDCRGTWLTGTDNDGAALVASRIKADEAWLNEWDPDGVAEPFTAAGTIDLVDAEVTGSLTCSGAQLTARNGVALAADRIRVGRNTSFDRVVAEAGALRLAGASIVGRLDCRGARLIGTDSDGTALVAYRVKIGDDVLLGDGFTAGGGISLIDAEIAGSLTCTGAQLAADDDGSALAGKRMKVRNVRLDVSDVPGALDLTDAEVTGSLICTGAHLTARAGIALAASRMKAGEVRLDGWDLGRSFTAAGIIDLVDAEVTGSLTCSGAQLTARNGAALAADRIRVGENVSFDRVVAEAGALRLAGASIVGRLDCRGARLAGTDNDGTTLIAHGMKAGEVRLDEWNPERPFTAAGTIDLVDAEVTGFLVCTGARLTASRGSGALAADRIRVGKNVLLDRVVTEAGALRLAGASIVGRLDCRGARLAGSDDDRSVLVAYGMKVGDDVLLSGGFSAAGGVSLVDAQIAGSLTCTGAQLAASHDGRALAAKRMKARNVWLNSSDPADPAQRFTADGTVDLADADIGDLNCTDAYLRAADIAGDTKGYALYADGTKVSGDVRLCQKLGKFTATGAILLSGADITGELILTNAFLIGADSRDNALYADEMKVAGNADLTGALAVGTVSFKSATVGGSLRLKPRQLAGSGYQTDGGYLIGKDQVALDASGTTVAQELDWDPAAQVFGRVILEHAAVGRLTDNWTGIRSKSGFWPPNGRLRLDGLTYTTIGGDHSADLGQRLTWIRSQYPEPPDDTARFATQPYELLANFYQQAGQDSEARAVAIARRRDLRKHGHLTWYRVALNWVLDKTIRYGYETWRAVLALVVLYVAAVAIFWIAQHHGNLIVPVMQTAGGHQPPPATRCTSAYPCFYPIGYAIDTVIPIINVRQATYWSPNGHAAWGTALVGFTWAGTLLGWALATLAVAGYTGLARNADSL